MEIGGIVLYFDDEEVFDYVSNSYLVFRKLKNELGNLLDYDNSDKTLNSILIKKIKSICEFNLSIDDIDKRITTLKRFNQFSICNEYYYRRKTKQNYNLLMLEYGNNRILLNYLKGNDKFEPVEKYYVPNDMEIEDFSLETEIFGENYLIINTFDSFTKYSELNKLSLTRDNNYYFFRHLVKAIYNENTALANGTFNEAYYFLNKYKYIVMDHVIMIIDYDCLQI